MAEVLLCAEFNSDRQTIQVPEKFVTQTSHSHMLENRITTMESCLVTVFETEGALAGLVIGFRRTLRGSDMVLYRNALAL